MNDDFIGSGWAFPLGTDAAGGIALVSGERELEQSMWLILSTAPGERPMRPEFGCAIHDRVFDSTDHELAGHIAADVEAALLQWEPRVTVRDIDVVVDRGVPGLVHIDIHYTTVATNDPRNLVFPFYSIPGEGPS